MFSGSLKVTKAVLELGLWTWDSRSGGPSSQHSMQVGDRDSRGVGAGEPWLQLCLVCDRSGCMLRSYRGDSTHPGAISPGWGSQIDHSQAV